MKEFFKKLGEIIFVIFFGGLFLITYICSIITPPPTLLDVVIEIITLKTK